MPFFKPKPKPKLNLKSKTKTDTTIVSVEEQISIDKTRCSQMMAAAEASVKARNFAQAEDLYSACLPIMEQVYAGDSKAMADCLTALGDVFYWQDKFGLALPIYQRLLAMRERMKESSPASLVTAYFKTAKAQEHLSNIEEARDLYKRASEIAQKTLMLGHPLLTSVLEAYANFLQEKTTNQGLADDIRRKAKTSRDTYVDPELLKSDLMEGKVGDVKWKEMPVSKTKDPSIWKNADEQVSNHPLVQALRKLREHPRMTIAFLTLPLSLGLLVVIISATYYLSGGEMVQAPLVHEKDIFRSSDSQQTIEVLPKNKLSVKTVDRESKLDYITLSNPWRELQYFFVHAPKGDIVLYKNTDSLTDSNGRTFEPGSAPTISTIMDMERFGKGLHKANTLSSDESRKAKIREFCARFTYENPYTHQKETPNILFGEFEPSGRPDQLVDYFRRTRTFDPHALSQRSIVKFAEKAAYTRSLIKCVVVPGTRDKSKASFFIIATDDRGTLLRQPDSEKTLLMSSTAGGEPEFNRPVSTSAKIPETARIVISKVSKESICTAAYLLAWVFILLPIMLIGYKMFEPRFNRSPYVNNESVTEIYLYYMYVIALFAYICYFTGIVFYVMSI